MRRHDRYLLRELMLPFSIGTIGALLLLTALSFYRDLSQTARDQLPVAILVRTILYQSPSVLVMALPVATALAVSLAIGRLVRDNEITVLRAIGISVPRLCLPIAAFGLLSSLLAIGLSETVVPWAWRQSQRLQRPYDTAGLIEPGLTVRADDDIVSVDTLQALSETRLRLTRIVLIRADGTIVTAPTAEYEAGRWRLDGAWVHRYHPDGLLLAEESVPLLTLTLPVDFHPSSLRLSGDALTNLSFGDLTRDAAEAARRGERRRALELEVNRWFKLSLPAMCLPFALIAPPLVLRFSRAGSFVGVLLSILVVFVGWNTLLLMKYLALGGFWFLPPLVAAWSTDLLFVLAALGLLRSAR
jgi:lipopolysaccharide export system permease protein